MKKYFSFIIAIFIALIPISSAEAESAWRYWSYWQLNNGTWEMAMTGAADVKAEDGQVQGWRYITAGTEISDDYAPRTEETFENICADVPAKAGIARIALVVDFGDASDYSNEADVSSITETQTSCVEVNSGDPSSLLLSSAFETREEGGMVCAVNNLPSVGCGEEVELAVTTSESLEADSDGDETLGSTSDDSKKYLNLAAALLALGGLLVIVKNKLKDKNEDEDSK